MNGNIVFVGAGGAGLSNLVGILRDLGFHNLIGIDSQTSQITEQLSSRGVQIFPHGKYQVKSDDIVIYSSATSSSPEVQSAQKLKTENKNLMLIRDYFQFLGEISKYFKTIAFTGTNGKSSSSAMGIFAAKDLLPDFGLGIVGALVPDFRDAPFMNAVAQAPLMKGGAEGNEAGGSYSGSKSYVLGGSQAPFMNAVAQAPLMKGGAEGNEAGGLSQTKHYINYIHNLKPLAKELRNNQTRAEKKLWYDFLSKYHYKFQRQKPIEGYIVGFFCNELKLIIEVDGDSHFSDDAIKYDQRRTEILESVGFKVIRFTNEEVYNHFDAVCEIISSINEPPLPPLQRGANDPMLPPPQMGILADLRNIFTYIFTGRQLDYSLIKKYYFLLEACEYQRHFLTLDIDDMIITNLELEHTDYYQDRDDYESAFLSLISKIKGNAYVLPNLNSQKILTHPKTVIIQPQHFNFKYIRGDHQQENASLVFTLLNELTNHNNPNSIKTKIENFHGIWRRMEQLATLSNGNILFSDYGHVASSLAIGYKALKEKFPEEKLICIFQPHQMHRIVQGWTEFPEAMKEYNQIFIYDIYAARENIEDFSDEFSKVGLPHFQTVAELGEAFAEHCNATYLPEFSDLQKEIEKADSNSVIVVYSAGDIDWKLRQWLKL
ncbi:hypothetical protein AGMMS50249_2100 [candidate division SR1 bacterium]|nr:hypothetical protein AGMMS50249_2100 [candidate division SR1 bacterium]